VTDAIKCVQGKLDHLNAQREILQDIKENKAKSEDIDQQETNNDIFCSLHRKATINVHEYLRGLGVQGYVSMSYCYEIIESTAKAKSEVRKRIMAVDDEHDITITLKVGLEVDGSFDVDIFNDSKSALHSFKPHFYALVLIDIRMPCMDGFELYEELKKIDPDVKVCFLTASEMYHEEVREKDYSNLSNDVFIQKPILTDDLITEINKKIDST
jgi:CheY-like chemotaxis protein